MRTTTQYQHWEVLPVHAYDVNGDPYYTVWDMGYGSYSAGSSRVDEYSWKENYYTTNIYSDYFKQFDNGHYFKVMAGFNAELYKKGGLTGFGTDLITPSVPELNTTQDNKTLTTVHPNWPLPVSSDVSTTITKNAICWKPTFATMVLHASSVTSAGDCFHRSL